MPERDIKLYLNDILECIEALESYTGLINKEEFLKDRKTRDAVVRNLEVIGEAVKNIPDEIKRAYPQVNWKAASAMRDKLIHEYFGVSFPIVWETVRNDIPSFEAGIKEMLKALGKKPGL